MRLMTLLRTMLAVGLGAALLGSYVITRYLTNLEQSLDQNLRATQALVAMQREVRDRNALLHEMTSATERLDQGLGAMLAESQAIGAQVKVVNAANRSTLALNGELAGDGERAAADLARVATALQAMNGSVRTIRERLGALQAVAAADAQELEAVGANTARMNLRTPGGL